MSTTNTDSSVRCANCGGPLENSADTVLSLCKPCNGARQVAEIMDSHGVGLHVWHMCELNTALRELKLDPEAFAVLRRFTALLWEPPSGDEPDWRDFEPRDSESENWDPEYGPRKSESPYD